MIIRSEFLVAPTSIIKNQNISINLHVISRMFWIFFIVNFRSLLSAVWSNLRTVEHCSAMSASLNVFSILKCIQHVQPVRCHSQPWLFSRAEPSSRHSSASMGQACLLLIGTCSQTEYVTRCFCFCKQYADVAE